jgi:hypothetical protein
LIRLEQGAPSITRRKHLSRRRRRGERVINKTGVACGTASDRKKAIRSRLDGARLRDYADRIAGRAALEVFMQRLSLIAATIALTSFPAGTVLAQTTAAPAAAPPAATTAPSATSDTTAAEPAKPAKKKPAKKKMTRQQEIDKSIDSGTVPARYRSSVPKQYHHLIPFDKR